MRGREGGMKKRNGSLLTCASEKQKKVAVSKARVLFSSLFSSLGVFVKGAVVSSVYLYILFRERENAQTGRERRSLMKCVRAGWNTAHMFNL